MTATTPPRRIRSFVRREGRLTKSQAFALEHYWPLYGIDLDEPIEIDSLFKNSAPLIVEIGFGNGRSLLTMAQQAPEKNFIGIEVHRPGVGHILLGIHQQQLTNLKVISIDAVDALQKFFPDNSISKLQIYFPDPWHKKRHHKRRLINARFLDLIHKKLQQDGVIHLATDWQHYAEHMIEVFTKHEKFHNLYPKEIYVPHATDRPTTKFEQRGQRLGHGVWDLLFSRT